MTTKKPTTEETLPDYFTDDDVVSWESASPEELEDFEQRLIEGYIRVFNRTHETELETLEELEAYQKEHDLTVESSVDFDELAHEMTTRPHEYVHTTGKLTKYVFENNVTREKGSDTDFDVPLDTAKKIFVTVSLDYKDLLESLGEDAQVPKLSDDDWEVFDGIVTNLVAGNWMMTYSMIYRANIGKIETDNLYIPPDVFEKIDTALDHFRGILKINNAREIKVRPDAPRKYFDGPILHFDRLKKEVVINGKKIDGEKSGVIIVYTLPSLYEFAQLNGKEIDFHPVELLDVKGVNNTPTNRKIKRYLYKRITIMQSDYKRRVIEQHKPMKVSRDILLKSLFEYIGKDIDTTTQAGKIEKSRLVKTINLILSHWKGTLFVSSEWKREKGSRELRGVEINFSKKLEKKSPRSKK